MSAASRRFVAGVAGTALSEDERRLYSELPPFGFLLLPRNLESARQTAGLVAELRALAEPAPLVFVDQEGGPVDRLGPLLGVGFPPPSLCAEKGADRVHESAYLMGRAARLLGFDVDLAPVVDLAQPKTGAVILAGRTFGFHVEDVALSALMFVHGLARAGVASCLKHFPGIGRGPVDSHDALPVVDAHDVDLMVTDVAPFTRLARAADCVMVGHAAYPGFTGEATPASVAPRIYAMLRGPVAFEGVAITDELAMGALEGALSGRAVAAAVAGADLLTLASAPLDVYEEAASALLVRIADGDSHRPRLDLLRARCASAPRPIFDAAVWRALGADVEAFLEALERPRPARSEVAEPP